MTPGQGSGSLFPDVQTRKTVPPSATWRVPRPLRRRVGEYGFRGVLLPASPSSQGCANRKRPTSPEERFAEKVTP